MLIISLNLKLSSASGGLGAFIMTAVATCFLGTVFSGRFSIFCLKSFEFPYESFARYYFSVRVFAWDDSAQKLLSDES